MPVRTEDLEVGRSLPVSPGTNAHELLAVLVDHSDLAFSAGELAELTTVPEGSVSKTRSRLADRDLVRRIDGYWAATDEVTAERVASLASLEAIADRYGRDDEWAEELPDLGENG